MRKGAVGGICFLLALVLGLIATRTSGPAQTTASRVPAADPALARLLPKSGLWKESEPARSYLPESLFEYIDGAAESFIGYDFRRLIVGQYVPAGGGAGSLTVEIYDMSEPRNAFGIYSAERYPDSRFIPTGDQGYYEEGSLNFLAGRYYVKLMCYECGPDAEKLLTALANDIASRVPDRPGFPDVLTDFPRAGLVANSEKFILRNFQGLAFLGNAFQASYRADGAEYEAFIVENRDAAAAAEAAKLYLENYRKAGLEVKPSGSGWTFRDKYLLNVFFALAGRDLCGVVRVPDGREALGRAALEELVKNAGAPASGPATGRRP